MKTNTKKSKRRQPQENKNEDDLKKFEDDKKIKNEDDLKKIKNEVDLLKKSK